MSSTMAGPTPIVRAGGRYYPKLQASVPFTPVTGKRLLVRACGNAREREALLLQAAVQVADRLGVSSLHVTFPTRDEWQLAGEMGLLQRTDQQFHWQNENYRGFDDFLASLASRKRKAIRKERREALDGRHRDRMGDGQRSHRGASGRVLRLLHGHRLAQMGLALSHAANASACSAKPWPIRCCWCSPSAAGRYVAGALNFIGADTLYGRYWGGVEDHPFLHFEICYYQAIDFAIAHRLARVEAGAQGAHKLARGYLPSETYSAHYIADPALRRAVADYLKRERRAVAHEIALLSEESPYRNTEGR